MSCALLNNNQEGLVTVPFLLIDPRELLECKLVAARNWYTSANKMLKCHTCVIK